MATRKSKRFFGMALILCLALFVASEMTAGDITARAQGDLQAQTELGARLYAENCAICHGPNGEGRVGATLAKNWPSIRPDLTVKTIIVNGVPGTAMPAWGQEKGGPLNGEEIDALVSYILSWQTSGQR
jgi:mono/diheme cytochrome c family protein